MVQPVLFSLCRFRLDSAGIRFPTSPPALTPAALLSSGCSSPRSRNPLYNRTHQRIGKCTSPEVPCPYSVRQSLAPVDPGRSTVQHLPPSGFLTPSTAYFARNHAGLISSPLRSWGSPGSDDSPRSFDPNRAAAPESPLQGSLFPRDERLVAVLLSRASSVPYTAGTHVPALPVD